MNMSKNKYLFKLKKLKRPLFHKSNQIFYFFLHTHTSRVWQVYQIVQVIQLTSSDIVHMETIVI